MADDRAVARGRTSQRHTLEVRTPSIEILIGGSYRDPFTGGEHRYGHAALRVVDGTSERVYDYGRYGQVTGEFGAEGEGMLRVWSDFNAYIQSENRLGRLTTGFTYAVKESEAKAINAYYQRHIDSAVEVRMKSGTSAMRQYKLQQNYHALGSNCATMTLGGAKRAFPEIDRDSARHNQGRGLNAAERIAARARNFGAWPKNIFMPADVQAMLEASDQKPLKVTKYGGTK